MNVRNQIDRAFLLVLAAGISTAADADFFEMKVRPVLAANCLACHAATKMGGLEMSSREAMLKGGASGPALIPGDPDRSLMIQAVRQTHAKLKMPPTGKLPEDAIEVLTTWVRDGAAWPQHQAPAAGGKSGITPEQRQWWAFQPVKKVDSPAVKNTKWAVTPIDRFVLRQLEAKGLQPVQQADRRTLLRRASYDLTGLPPSPQEVDSFLRDASPDAFAKAVDRLLASPRYGERWGRYWLDIARYADQQLNAGGDQTTANAWRYRDWVVQAFNDDMPYDQFVKAQLAGDQMEPKERYVGGLGLFANNPEFQDDRIDTLTRGFLGMTVACARCHDHKFDPIPTRDYYSLLGIFESSRAGQFPLSPPETVKLYKDRKAAADKQKEIVDKFESEQASQLAEILAGQSVLYLRAARSVKGTNPTEQQVAQLAEKHGVDAETLGRWLKYLEKVETQQHPMLREWTSANFDDGKFQNKLLKVIADKAEVDRENLILLGGKDDNRTVRVVEVRSLERDDYYLWEELISGSRRRGGESGVLYYKGAKLDRFLAPAWKGHLDRLRAELGSRNKEVPEPYPFLITLEDIEKPRNGRIQIRGDRTNLGDEVPRGFLTVLCDGKPSPFTKGSGRMELAESIVDPKNPLTSRVIVNRVWTYHFGRPLVGTTGNFGRLGEQPSHPELLDYLSARLVEEKWSLKKLHREIMLSNTYALSAARSTANESVDADNKFYWRANRRRLDVEPLRDTLLMASGELDETIGGPPVKITDANNRRKTIYAMVSRKKLDGTLALFDFPNPIATSDGRVVTATPLQQLFFLNSEFIRARARMLADRVQSGRNTDPERIREAYRILFQRDPSKAETDRGVKYLAAPGSSWPTYAQALMSTNELLFVD
jgi:hypothetical protein